MELFKLAERLRSSPGLGWGLAFGLFVLATLLRFVSDPYLPTGFPYLTYFPAVILSALLGGLLPGIACAVLSGLAAWYWFIPPATGFGLTPPVAVALLFYAFVVTVDIALIQVAQKTVSALDRERERSERLYGQQRAMFQELQHRVANNMQFVSSLLNLQKRKLADDPASAETVLDEARARLETMARLHRRLYHPETVDMPAERYFQELCDEVVLTSGAEGRGVSCIVSARDVSFSLDRLTTLSLVVVELVTNSLKHAFDGRGGTIRVGFEPAGGGRMRLVVADDGVGFNLDRMAANPRSLGQRIVGSLAAQMGGEVTFGNESGGATTRLSFKP